MIVFNPEREHDERHGGRGLMGWVGPFPWEPCRKCGGPMFTAGDWHMGWRCTTCQTVFGTDEEWGR